MMYEKTQQRHKLLAMTPERCIYDIEFHYILNQFYC